MNSIDGNHVGRRKLSELSQKQINAKVTNDNVECNNISSSTRDSCWCKDACFTNTGLRQDLSDLSIIPYSNFNVCDNSIFSRHRGKICSSKTTAKLNDSNDSTLETVCNNAVRNNYFKNNDEISVWKNNRKNIVCDAVNDNWLSKSVCTDNVPCDKVVKEFSADSCRYHSLNRHKVFQDSVLNRNDIWKKQMGHKILQQSPESCQREHMARQSSMCSCIPEEEEDYCTNTNVVAKHSEKIYNNAKQREKIPIRRRSPSKLAENMIIKEFNTAGEHLDKTQTWKSAFEHSTECSKNTAVCQTLLKNSGDFLQTTRVCKKFVAKELPKDNTVCKTMFADLKGPAKEETVCEVVHCDSKEIAKKITCKVLDCKPAVDSKQNKVEEASLHDERNKLVKERKLDSPNLKDREKNIPDIKKTAQLNDNSISSNLLSRVITDKDGKKEQLKDIISNIQSKVLKPSRSTINSKLLSTDNYSRMLPRKNSYNRQNLVSNYNAKEPSKISFDRRWLLLLSNRVTKSSNQQTNKVWENSITQDLMSNQDKQIAQKQEEMQMKEEMQDEDNKVHKISVNKKPVDSLLYRSFKKVVNVIRRDKELSEDKIKPEKNELLKMHINDKKDIVKSADLSKKDDRITYNDHQQVSAEEHTSERSLFTSKKITNDVMAMQNPIASASNVETSTEDKKIDVFTANQTTRLKPKLLRIIATKRLYLKSTERVSESKPQNLEVEPIQESILVQTIEKIKTNKLDAPEINVYENKDITESAADISKTAISETGISKDVECRGTETYVACAQKNSKEKLQEFISCESANNNACSFVKFTNLEHRYHKDNKSKNKNDRCQYCCLETAQCTCVSKPYFKKCFKYENPKFCNLSSSIINQRVGIDYYRVTKECMCKETVNRCCRSRYKCYCPICTYVKCYNTKRYYEKAMICLYCDNPRDKCICRAPVRECTFNELPSDNCNCQNNKDCDCYRERVVEIPHDYRTIQVTSWKPNKKIKQYFVRNPKDFRSEPIEDCHHRGKSKRHLEELPYQRLNVFSDVMNELQRKMSEFICCTRCKSNPCRCESKVDRDKEKEGRRAKCYIRYPQMEMSRIRSSNCYRSSHNVQESIPFRHVRCTCKLSPFRCKKNKPDYEKPSLKCYYCKSFPCACKRGNPVTEVVQVHDSPNWY